LPLAISAAGFAAVMSVGLIFLLVLQCWRVQSQAEKPFHWAESSSYLNDKPLKNNIGIISQTIQTSKRNEKQMKKTDCFLCLQVEQI